jgi:gamma-glutamylcyclotransferase (GGCT)/AIG2-like uncharacterized protein YtfP
MSECLFVYGTLLPGRAPAEVADAVRRLRRVGPGHVQGRLYDLGDYPGAILDRSSHSRIPGQVFELPDDETVLASLDEYEEFRPEDPRHSLFLRIKSPVTMADGHRLDCWMYVYNREPGSAPLWASQRRQTGDANVGRD